DETFQAIRDEFHWPLQQLRKRDYSHFVGVGMNLDTEGASNILCDDTHLMLGESEMLREQVLHHVRRLRALINGHPLFADIPVGDDGTRFQTNTGMATET